MNAIVSEKGQITIPKQLRDDLGLTTGTLLDFTEEHGCLVARKVLSKDIVSHWRGKGHLPGQIDVDSYLQIVRDGK
jgi:AbrB family looped-hinge helix DNA binding protein